MTYEHIIQLGIKVKKVVIQVGFPEDNHLGCDKHCSFCFFNLTDYNIPVYPSDEDIDKLLDILDTNGLVQICGAGDPLFHLEKNKDKLLHIINYCISRNFRVQIVTKYYEVVQKEWQGILKDVSSYVFSSETIDEQLYNLIDLLTTNGKRVRLGKIYNFEPTCANVNRDYILQYITYYSRISNKDLLKISLRSNFHYPEETKKWLAEEKQWVTNNLPENSCHTFLHGPNIGAPLLWNHEIVQCKDTISMIERDMNIKLKDLLK